MDRLLRRRWLKPAAEGARWKLARRESGDSKVRRQSRILSQRVEDNAFHLRVEWIGFSEDDVKTIAEGARFALPEHRAHQKSGGKAAFNFNNALRTTRSLRALNEVDRLLRRRCLLPRAREQDYPGAMFRSLRKKFKFLSKKVLTHFCALRLKRALHAQNYEGKLGTNKKTKKNLKKSIDISLAFLLQAMRPVLLPAPKFYPHQPITTHEKEIHFTICFF